MEREELLVWLQRQLFKLEDIGLHPEPQRQPGQNYIILTLKGRTVAESDVFRIHVTEVINMTVKHDNG
jgi:hypothetical protein